jgi:protein SCO1/2
MRGSLALAALVVVVAAGAARAGGGFDGPTVEHPVRVPDFALRDQNGRMVRLSAQRGRVVLLTFLYTHCPDVCPLTAAYLDRGARGFPAVRVLAVSVDPRGDTRAAVGRFVRSHHLGAEFHFLTGSRDALRAVWSAYGVTSTSKADGRTVTSHTLYTLLIDQNGRDRVVYDATAKPNDIAHDLRLLLSRP